MMQCNTSERAPKTAGPQYTPNVSALGALGLTLVLAALGGAGCAVAECVDLDVLEIRGVARDGAPPDDTAIVWGGGEGGLSVSADTRDLEVFEPLRAHLGAAATSTAGIVRWSVLIGLDRILLVEHALPVSEDQTIFIDEILEDVEFTGGGTTQTWWDDRWLWTEGSTTAPPRAMLTEAFDTELSATAVTGRIDVREVDPVVFRVGLEFTTRRGTEAYWGDLEFRSNRGVTFCR